MIDALFRRISADRDLHECVRHRVLLPPQTGSFADPDPPLPPVLRDGLQRMGIERLYAHQAQSIAAVRRGEHTVVVTPTASGKTLTYFLPVAEALLADPGGRALLLFPLKALEQDQLQKIGHWQRHLEGSLSLTAEIFDGDTPRARRAKIKKSPPHFLISNPDMLHQGILAYHQGWEAFLKRLRWIVIDELHAYRGVFGSHILQVLRRLSRLLTYYGASPQFICLSATIANPLELAGTLTGRTFTRIDQSGAPAGSRELWFVDPPASTTSAAVTLFTHALDLGLKTIVFTKARVTTEVLHRIVRETRPDLAPAVSSYRAGFLPEERRDIERQLVAGQLKGVISTSALELGIDIGGLDVCILVGYPGSIMSLWQRAGRVGRRGAPSAVIWIAGSDALDRYFLRNPQELLERSFEAALVNEANEEILRAHLPAAAAEIPLMTGDPHLNPAAHADVIADLEREGALLRSAAGSHWFAGAARPHAGLSLRNVGGTFQIVRDGERRALGEISGGSVFRECHDGAIYLHCGEQFQVTELDLEQKRVRVRAVDTTVYTMARSDKQTEIIDDREHRVIQSFSVHTGKVKVTETYHSFERRRVYSQELLSVEPLDLPPQSYTTSGVWLQFPTWLGDVLAADDLHYMGGIHAVEHAAISLIPLFCLCDRNDVGGISFTRHPQLPGGAIFFYDGYPGGAGIAEYIYRNMEALLTRTRELVAACPCEAGCPSCIQSPKCGSGNKPLDKTAAVRVLDELFRDADRPTVVMTHPAPVMADEPPAVAWRPRAIPEDRRVLVFDLETQRSADEVGGWSQARQMRLAVAAVWNSATDETRTFDEAQVEELLSELRGADLVVGFNIRRFDYEVLRGYTFDNLNRLPTLDLLEEVERSLGRRLKLDTLVAATLGTRKTADGLQSLAWFKEGRMDLVTDYCIHDTEITRDLLRFALQHGFVLYERNDAGVVRVPLALDLDTVMNKPTAEV